MNGDRPRLPPHEPRPAAAPTVLEGLRVLDFTRMMAGPYSTMELADLGAEVIKVETPGRGDDSRHYTTTALAGECAFYLSTNRSKRSICIDLKNDEGRRVARELVDGADVVVENFSNGVMERFGLDYATVSADHPSLIYCSVSSYGREEATEIPRRGYDAMFQAASGFMSLTGEADGRPMRTTVPIVDIATAMTATSAILAAVIARDRLGVGQYVELALIDVAMSLLTLYGTAYLVSGDELGRNGNRAPQTAPSDVFETRDGLIFLTCGNDRLFRTLATEALGRPDIADDPDFATNPQRVRHQAKLTGLLAEAFAAGTRDEWIERLSALGVPVAPVNTIGEAVDSPDVRRRGLLTEIAHPTAGTVPNVRSPYRMSATPPADPVAPPLLGQHTDEILHEVLGYDAPSIAALARAGAFGAG